MLRNEHLRFRITSPRVKPLFVDPADPALLDTAAGAIALFLSARDGGMTRRELEEMCAAAIRADHDPKIAAGLFKLLTDRCRFLPPEDADYPSLRRETFLAAAKMLRSGEFTADALRAAAPAADLYGDLPGLEKLVSLREITPEALLHRYDLALAQGLVCFARSLTVEIASPESPELRRLLKSVKFFRLLARFTVPAPGRLKMEISGPFSIFDAGNKYALQLANFLPAVVRMPKWELTAGLRLREKELTMKLSDRDHLVSHYRELGTYIPEEIRLYHREFAEKTSSWRIVGDTPFLDAGDQEVIFPDLSFLSSESGEVRHVELFHRWHAGALAGRIELLRRRPELPLLLGIDRALLKKSETPDDFFALHPELRERCWFFRDFPGVASTVAVLNRWSPPGTPRKKTR